MLNRKSSFLITFLICMLCVGCNNDNINKNINIEKIYDTDEKYPAQACWWNDNIKAVKDGYYFISNDLLYYWDSNTKDGTIVCSATNCNHTNAMCNAYFGMFGNSYQYGFSNLDLEIYNNHIYKIGHELGEVADFYIYSVSMDGSQRENMGYIYSIELDAYGGITMTYDWVMINGYYYGEYGSDKEPTGLYKIRIDGAKTLLYDVSDKEQAYISRINGYEEFVYFTLEWCENTEAKAYKTYFMRYNTNSEVVEQLLEESVICEYCIINENQIFYSDVSGKGYLLNIDTKEEKCIMENGADGIISSDGIYLYIFSEKLLSVYDIDGRIIDEISIDAGNVLFGDEDYLFIEAPIVPGEVFVEDEYKDVDMWILDKKQLGQSEKKWIKMDLE